MLFAEAYIKAGYKAKTTAIAARNGSRIVTNNDIVVSRIAELRAPTIKAMEITTTKTLNRLAAIAYGDLGDVMTWGRDFVVATDSERLTPEQRAMVKEIKMLPDGTVVVSLRDPTPALKLLGQHQGAFSGESVGALPGGDTHITNNQTVIYVDSPPNETADQWEQRQRKRVELGRLGAVDAPAGPTNGSHKG